MRSKEANKLKHNNLFSEPIKCDAPDTVRSVMEAKCWIEGVYLDGNLMNGTFGQDKTKWGVGPPVFRQKQMHINQAYYQWVVPVIALMALLSFMPQVIYFILENETMKTLMEKIGEKSFGNNQFITLKMIFS